MELLLNLIWLLIAVASFARWRRRLMAVRANRRSHLRAVAPLLAFVCALAIVFPVISVTDDLHAQLAVTDDSSARRRSSLSLSGGHESLSKGKLSSPPALLSTSALEPAFRSLVAGWIVMDSCPRAIASVRNLSGRAPPTL